MNEPKRLYRIEQGAKLAGVCGGIAEYFNIDANLIRLIWIILTILTLGFGGVVIYLVAAFLLPKKSDVYPGY